MRDHGPRTTGATTAALTVFLCLAGAVWAADPARLTFLQDEGEGEFDVTCDLRAPASWPRGAEARLVFNYRDESHFLALRLRKSKAQFIRCQRGKEEPIGSEGTLPRNRPTVALTLQRHSWEITLLADGAVVCRAHDITSSQGRVGYASEGGLSLEDVRLQPVAPVRFGDNFMRDTGASGTWERLSGRWEQQGLTGPNPTPTKAANPFSLRAVALGRALSAAGYWFWDRYDFRAAARGEAEGALGLCCCLQDQANFYLFRWTRTGQDATGEPRGRLQLIKSVQGRWYVLAEKPRGYRANVWYQLGVRTDGDHLECLVDGVPVLRARDETFAQGRIALYADCAPAVNFDDASVSPWLAFDEDFSRAIHDRWTTVRGKWHQKKGRLLAQASASGSALALTGAPSWNNYAVGADISVRGSDSGGICLAVQPNGDGYLLAVTPEQPGPHGLCTLARMQQGNLVELARAPLTARVRRLKLSLADGHLAGYANGQRLVETVDVTFRQGRAGLWARGSGVVTFDNVAARFWPPPPSEPPITEQFTREDTMSDWARGSSAWQTGDGGLLWHRDLFFHDMRLLTRLPNVKPIAGGVKIVLAPGADAARALNVDLRTAAGSDVVEAKLTRGDTVLSQAHATAAPDSVLRLEQAAGCVQLKLNNALLLAAAGCEPLHGGRVGLQQEGLTLDLNQASLTSSHSLDYTFSRAPTAWQPGFGLWQVTDRWACSPGWAWFGGTKHKSPLLWTKRDFFGDQTLDFWAALPMDLPGRPGYSHPSDINCILCGDGTQLCRGYSFIFAGDNNTRSKILRGDQVVAENTAAKFINPTSSNAAFHRHWFHVSIRKLGPRLTFAVDGKQILEYTDPAPLPGGRMGLWSFNNGLLIARARISFERSGE